MMRTILSQAFYDHYRNRKVQRLSRKGVHSSEWKRQILSVFIGENMTNAINMVGRKIGKLTVLKQDPIKNRKGAMWICECECGNIKSINGGDLRKKSGGIRSCGCSEHQTKHNMCGTKEYEAWRGMKRRCYNKNYKGYKNYGGRGIQICESWKYSFEDFYKDMGPCPKGDTSIDRRNNDGDYETSNCKWSTRVEQNRNRRINKIKNIDQANEIRSLYETGKYTQKELSIMYNCLEQTIYGIVNNKNWI